VFSWRSSTTWKSPIYVPLDLVQDSKHLFNVPKMIHLDGFHVIQNIMLRVTIFGSFGIETVENLSNQDLESILERSLHMF